MAAVPIAADAAPTPQAALGSDGRGSTGLGSAGTLAFCLALIVAEIVLLALAVSLNWPAPVWIGCHLAIVATAGVWLWRQKGTGADLSGAGLALLGCLIAGPLGALLATIAVVWLARQKPDTHLLAAWYERIALAGDTDPVTALCNSVDMGRTVQTAADIPRVFADVMAHGTLEDRQTALGLIARQFSPSYAPALRAALVSSEPVIRVQAAAVAVKVRAELKSTLHATLARHAASDDVHGTLALAAELHDMAHSLLLEDTDRAAAERRSGALVAQAIDGRTAAMFAHDRALPSLSPGTRTLIETELLRRGELHAFRAVRSHAAALMPQIETAPGRRKPGHG
jgi:hypothetical protein